MWWGLGLKCHTFLGDCVGCWAQFCWILGVAKHASQQHGLVNHKIMKHWGVAIGQPSSMCKNCMTPSFTTIMAWSYVCKATCGDKQVWVAKPFCTQVCLQECTPKLTHPNPASWCLILGTSILGLLTINYNACLHPHLHTANQINNQLLWEILQGVNFTISELCEGFAALGIHFRLNPSAHILKTIQIKTVAKLSKQHTVMHSKVMMVTSFCACKNWFVARPLSCYKTQQLKPLLRKILLPFGINVFFQNSLHSLMVMFFTNWPFKLECWVASLLPPATHAPWYCQTFSKKFLFDPH